MFKLTFNYHTHTKRCGHAVGEDEEYVLQAIKLGIKKLGFSDHVILPKGFEQPGIRGSSTELEDYLNSVKYLKEKYKDQIEIFVGFEAEYYPQMVEYYKWLLENKVDYLIMGQHCYLEDNKFHWYFHKDSPIEDIKKYTDDVIAGLKTGLFKYLAHPDLFMHSQSSFNKEIEEQSRRILKTCEELHIPVEINLCGGRRRDYDGLTYSYPNEKFFDLVKDYNLDVIIGMDVHDPNHFEQIAVDLGYEFAKRHSINPLEDFDIK